MEQVSRDKNLKIPKQIKLDLNDINIPEDVIETKKAILMANNEKFKKQQKNNDSAKEVEDVKLVTKIPASSNDLVVITMVKKLGAYVIAISEKAPKKFRGVFVSRMQNYCLETLELLLKANYIRMDSLEKKQQRSEYQKEAIIKLKLLGYISMVAENAGCILKKQYKQTSIQLAQAIQLISAWQKSDNERWKKRN